MAVPVLVKVYGYLYPASEDLQNALLPVADLVLPPGDWKQVPVVCLEGDILRLAFEGLYFPVEETVEIIRQNLQVKQEGKLDVLDLEHWQMFRYRFAQGQIQVSRKASLNDVLAYSGF